MEQKLHSGHGTLQSHHQLYLSDPVRILQPWGISRRYEATAGFLQSVPTTDGRHCCGNSVVLIAGLAALLLGLWVGTKADCLPGSYIISMNFDVWSRDLLSGQVHCSVVAFHCCFCGWTKALAISNTPGKSAAWRLWFKSHFAGGTKRNQWKHFNWNRNQNSYLLKDVQKEQSCWHADRSHITQTGTALSMQAFFWISFRLFPTLPPSLLTETTADASPLLMLQIRHSDLKPSTVMLHQGKPHQWHTFNRGAAGSPPATLWLQAGAGLVAVPEHRQGCGQLTSSLHSSCPARAGAGKLSAQCESLGQEAITFLFSLGENRMLCCN